MREIKYRYIVTEPAKNITHRLYHTLEGIERLDPNHQIFKPSYKIVARDLYTGLKDKNGVEIYEGDIVEVYSWVSNIYRGVVKFGEYEQDASGGEYKPRPVLGFYIDALKGQLDKWGDEFLFDFEMRESIFSDLENSKVIGNIYEHPHLLEVSE